MKLSTARKTIGLIIILLTITVPAVADLCVPLGGNDPDADNVFLDMDTGNLVVSPNPNSDLGPEGEYLGVEIPPNYDEDEE